MAYQTYKLTRKGFDPAAPYVLSREVKMEKNKEGGTLEVALGGNQCPAT